jgi:hypothetical protein
MRARYLVVVLLAIAAVAAIATKRLLYAPNHALAAPIVAPQGQLSYLIALGVNDPAGSVWDGSITTTGGTIVNVTGWRFYDTDSVSGSAASGNWSWKATLRTTPSFNPPGPVMETGVIVTVSAPSGPVTFNVTTKQGNFTFSSADVPFGVSKLFLTNGTNFQVHVMQTASPLQLTTSNEDQDFPSMAQSGDDVYLTYTEFTHGDRSQATALSTKTTITDFTPLSRPVGGEQVLLMHYSKSQGSWSGPYAVTGTSEDVMRTAVAIDGQGRAWIFYSTQRNGNFDLYVRSATATGTLSSEIRLTSDPGTDLFPVATTDANGLVWVAWQAYRNNNLEVMTAVQTGETFTGEVTASFSPASDWEPAIAASSDGEVAISWDTYDKGDYDVYVRRAHLSGGQIGFDSPIPVAATLGFEARSTLAFDPQNRLWIAYEVSGPDWGKDYGLFDTTGIALYHNHTIQVRCLVGNTLYSTTNDVAAVLPGGPNSEVFLPSLAGPYGPQPDPNLALNRQPNGDVGFSAKQDGPKNSHPRLAVDSAGTVYLAFREPAGEGWSQSQGTGNSVGSIWISGLVYFDGAQWHGPGILTNTDAVGDNRPVLLPQAPGHLLIGGAMDHRLTPLPNGTPQIDSANADIYMLDLPVAVTPQSPLLTKLAPATPATPPASVGAEAGADAVVKNYRPTVNGQAYQLLRGDFHRHTEISPDGARDGPLIDSYRYFIDAASLDWVGCCDHDDGAAREYSWWLIQKFTDAYLLGTKFVPMYYYERSVNYPEGHRNIVFTKRGIRPLPRLPLSDPNVIAPAPDTNMLYAYLHFFNGLSAPHTSATEQGTDYRNHDPVVEPFVEIYQGARQDYEMAGAPRAPTANDVIAGPLQPLGFLSNPLSMGYQYGFEASSDHVSTHISFTNLWVKSPTRAGVFEAMQNRRMYGSTDNILADFRSGAHFMGEAFTSATPPIFTVRLYGTAPFQNVSVIKDGNVVYSTSGDRVVSFSWQDTSAVSGKTSFYYVRGQQQAMTGQVNGAIVWVTPMWVTMQ